MSFDFSTLITDRTQADVNLQNAKGTYNATDLNRVNAAMAAINERLVSAGYASVYAPYEITHIDPAAQDVYLWYVTDVPTISAMAAYLANVEAIRSAIAALPTAPQTPADMELLTWLEANNIEQILYDINSLINNIEFVSPHSGAPMSICGITGGLIS